MVDPQDIDPDTGRPYPGYSSPALDAPMSDYETPEDDETTDVRDLDDDSYPPSCTARSGHRWVCRDDDGEISYCANCGADGNA